MEEERMDDVKQELDCPKEKKSSGNHFMLGVLAGVVLSTLMVGAVFAYHSFKQGDMTAQEQDAQVASDKTLKKLGLIHDLIQSKYALDIASEEEMADGVYKGLVESLGDPYSLYYTAEEMKAKEDKIEGVYHGIGCYVGIDNETGFARLGEIFEDSPAQESGLKEGDLIIKVDGTYVKDWSLSDVVDLIKGEEGSKVKLTIMRDGEDDFLQFDVERREVPTQTVRYTKMDDGIAYIYLKEFSMVTIDQFVENYEQAQKDGMKGLIIDLRDNLGGNLSACVEIARSLLPKGTIVYTEDKVGQRVDYDCDGTKEIEVPLVVLVNGNSASAAEILAGAIKDYKIGTLLGTKTFGKGIVQSLYPLSDGSAVKLTSSKYYTPNGNNIHGIGIEPDETLELDYEKFYTEGVDNQLERAKEIIKEKLG